MKRKYKSFFDNKTCDICKQKASIFRTIRSKYFMLCNNKECDLISRLKVGWIEELNIKGVKISGN